VIRLVESGFLKPCILKEISVPPLISEAAKFVTVSTELEKEHWIELCNEGEFEVHAMAPCRYSSCVVGDSGFHFGKVI
jgi:hypothetical protein